MPFRDPAAAHRFSLPAKAQQHPEGLRMFLKPGLGELFENSEGQEGPIAVWFSGNAECLLFRIADR